MLHSLFHRFAIWRGGVPSLGFDVAYFADVSQLGQYQVSIGIVAAVWHCLNVAKKANTPPHCGYREVLWGIVEHCEVLWGIVEYCGALWGIVEYCGALWGIVEYCGVL